MTNPTNQPDHARTAIVTGSTWRIGLGIARALSEAGMQIVINGFGNPTEIERDRAELESLGATVIRSETDTSKPDQVGFVIHATEPLENASLDR